MRVTATTILALGALGVIASARVAAQDVSDVAHCAGIDDAEARLACYDAAVGRTESARPDPEPAPLTQDVGQEQLENRPDSEPLIVTGRVTECRQSSGDRWLFVFDNGQVWRQRKEGRRSFRECDFGVTITRDFFGYKMQIDGETSWIRIGRIR